MKHILNNMSEQEKNSIREQHSGGMKVMTENFNKLINSKLGNVKPLLEEKYIDYLFDNVDELLKDYTNLMIVDDNEDGDRYKSVAYGERNNEEPTEPPYVYFNWSKSPINMPTGSLEFDKVLSDKLIPLDIPENVTKIILEKWVRKYYDNIPPISMVSFGDTLGYNQEFSKPDPNFKPDHSQFYMPNYDDDDDDEFEY